MLEGVKSPLQFVSLLESGKLGDPRGILDHDPGKHFHVYCKVHVIALDFVNFRWISGSFLK